MFCGLCCVEDDESSFNSESEGAQWSEEPEENRTLYSNPLLVNLDPALAQANQYSTMSGSNTHEKGDLRQNSSDAVSNNISPHCHTNDGDSDDDRENSINHMFPDYANNQGQVLPTNGTTEHPTRSRRKRRRLNCTFPGCDNNKGKGFSSSPSIERHIKAGHMGQRFNCTFPGCDNNQGKGYSDAYNIGHNSRSVHQGQKFNCTFPGCDNNEGK